MKTVLPTFWAIFEKNWATFYFIYIIIWSHFIEGSWLKFKIVLNEI